MQMNHDPLDDPFLQNDHVRRARAEHTLWTALGTLYRRRRFIVGVTMGVAVLAVVISLLLPNWYAASARLLPPASGSLNPLSAQLLRNLPSAASALLGGTSGDYARYLTILSSRTMYESVVDSFNLVEVYETGKSRTPREDAIAMLAKNVQFPVDERYEFLSVVVLDRDPQRAADMANFIVHRLNLVNAALSSQNAGSYRRFVERRYREAEAALDSVLDATQAFQQQYGVINLPTQAESFFEYVAALRANELQAAIQHEALRAQLGPENAQVQQLQSLAQAAHRKYQDALAGQEQLLPIPQASVPEVTRRYIDLERERLIQIRILEVVGPLYEQARFDEEREVQAVQVVDEAVPPVKKARPKRSVIVVAATLSAFLLTVIFVLLYEWWRHNHTYVSRRLQAAVDEPAPGRPESVETS